VSAGPASALAIAVGVGRGEARPSDVVAEALERIAARDPALHAVVTIDPADSLRQAEAVERRLAGGERPRLAGVPILVKDAIWVAGWRVTQGSRLFADFRAPRDNVAVARLRAAGAVVVGMANMSEFGCKGVTSNPLHGTTRHPLDARLTSGGSSGGCASALGAGLVPLALGTDGGGSARRPRPCGCGGVQALGRLLANGPGFTGGGSLTSVLAPMARSVADDGLRLCVGRYRAAGRARPSAADPGRSQCTAAKSSFSSVASAGENSSTILPWRATSRRSASSITSGR